MALKAMDCPKVCRTRIVASVIVDGNLASLEHNRVQTDPLQFKYRRDSHSIFLHAEIGAIKKALRVVNLNDLRRASMYVMRVKQISDMNPEFTWGLAKPCEGCYRAIVEFGFKEVIYSCEGVGHYEVLKRI